MSAYIKADWCHDNNWTICDRTTYSKNESNLAESADLPNKMALMVLISLYRSSSTHIKFVCLLCKASQNDLNKWASKNLQRVKKSSAFRPFGFHFISSGRENENTFDLSLSLLHKNHALCKKLPLPSPNDL